MSRHLQRTLGLLQRAAPLHSRFLEQGGGRGRWGSWLTQCTVAGPAGFSTIQEPDAGYLQASADPKFVHPVSILQLDNLCRHPTLRRLVESALFLKSQLPARLDNHLLRLKALKCSNSELEDLIHSSIRSKELGMDVARDWALVDTSTMQGLHQFEPHIAAFKEHLEVEIDRLVAGCNELTQQRDWFTRPDQVSMMDRALDLCHWYLLSARVMLHQHSAALHNLEHGHSSNSSSSSKAASSRATQQGGSYRGISSSAAALADAGVDPAVHYHEPSPTQASPANPWQPPHQQLLSGKPVSLVQRLAPVEPLVAMVVEDCRAFCVEKNSVAPDVDVHAEEGLQATLVVPYVEFVLMEVLKNALQLATIDRYGAWDVDEADPVRVVLREVVLDGRQMLEVEVTDMGNGIPRLQAENMYHYFWSSRQPKVSFLSAMTGYGYSRNHGSVFMGKGVGVPMSRVYAHFMGGSIEWETDAWKRHTTVKLRLPKHGFVL